MKAAEREADQLWEAASRRCMSSALFVDRISGYATHCMRHGVTSDEEWVHSGSVVLTEALDSLRALGVLHPHVLLPYAVCHARGETWVADQASLERVASFPDEYAAGYSSLPQQHDHPRSARMLASIINTGVPPLAAARSYDRYMAEATEQECLASGLLDTIVCYDGTLFLGDDGWWVA